MAHTEIVNKEIVITLPVEKVYSGLKEKLEEVLNNYPIKVIPVKKLTVAQNGLIHVLLKQFGEETGYTLIEIKELIKEQFSIATDKLEFSTSRCDTNTANEFIAFIIEQALELGINLYILGKNDTRYKHILEIDKVTERYIIACLKSKTCCICGREGADLHHYNSVASIGGYNQDDGLKTPFLPLCRIHHNEFHNIGVKSFEEKWHIQGIRLNEQLVYDLLKVYPNHFKLFRKRLKEGYYKNIVRR